MPMGRGKAVAFTAPWPCLPVVFSRVFWSASTPEVKRTTFSSKVRAALRADARWSRSREASHHFRTPVASFWQCSGSSGPRAATVDVDVVVRVVDVVVAVVDVVGRVVLVVLGDELIVDVVRFVVDVVLVSVVAVRLVVVLVVAVAVVVALRVTGVVIVVATSFVVAVCETMPCVGAGSVSTIGTAAATVLGITADTWIAGSNTCSVPSKRLHPVVCQGIGTSLPPAAGE
mmetsp:Transcript_10725/g.28482  ORF Transcript_10725/g.28482 Transcript_10725/m.28482 type:complete len:230 (+) Transcript_10725:1998-2687(+)